MILSFLFSLTHTWQLYVYLFLVGAVVYFHSYKAAVRNAEHDGAAIVLLELLSGLIALLFIPFFRFSLPTNPVVYVFLLAVCVFYAIYDRLQTTARKHLEVSVFSILNQLNGAFVIILGLFILGEPFIFTKLLGAGIIIFGNCLLVTKKKKVQLNRYVLFALFASIIFAFSTIIDVRISKEFNLPLYILFTTGLPALILILSTKIPLRAIQKEFNSPARKYYVLTSFAFYFTHYASLRSFQLGKVTTIVPLQALSVILTVLVASVIFKEKDNWLKKVVAALLVIGGVYLTVR